MAERDWAEALTEEAVLDDGSFREIRLPSMVRVRHGWPTANQGDMRSDVAAAVARGLLLEGPAELFCKSGHLAWQGSASDLRSLREARCSSCAQTIPREDLRLEETFAVPAAVAREVSARRGPA
jgi:hypothetical protein